MKKQKLLYAKSIKHMRFSKLSFVLKSLQLLVLIVLFSAFSTKAEAQTTLGGNVKDSEGMPLPGVTVMVKDTSIGTQTDFDGNYSIDVPENDSILVFSFVGMTTVTRTFNGNTTINVTLENDQQALDEVVVVGYGTQSRRSVTTAVAKVSEQDFNQGVVTSPMDLVQGKIAGLSVTRAGGNNPNSSASIQLRGVTSITGNKEPLIVIDGIPGGNLDLIQQNDIESFDVLKDGAASAIYGTRGNNGVILITTKKGKKGSSQFEYSSYVSRDYVQNKPKFLSAKQYREAIELQKAPNKLDQGDDYGYTTDIYDELVDKTNLSQYHNFVASGGSENSNYRASLYYQKLDGIALENDREEYGFRINFNQSAFNDKFNFQSSLATNFNNANLQGGDQFDIVTEWNPTTPIYAGPGGDLNNQGQFGYYQPENLYNPFSEYANRFNLRKQYTFSGDAKATYEIVEGLKIAAFGSYQRNVWNDRYYQSTEDWGNINGDYQGTGYARKRNHADYTKTFEPTITFERDLGDHSLNLLGGYSYQYSTEETYEMSNSGFNTDSFLDWNMGWGNAIIDTDLPRPGLDSFKEDNTLIAFFSRINYSYLERYFLTASIRREGSSKFGANNKWGNFPAISAGWMISDEAFMNEQNVFSNLKLRVGYGITGNQGIPNYQSLVTLGTGGKYPIFLNNAKDPTYYQTLGAAKNPNPDLRWERKKEINFGLDFGFLSNRITGALDVYRRTTEDLLYKYAVPQPPYVRDDYYTNVGTIRNSGIELALSATIINEGGFQWSVDATGNYQKNTLVKLSNEQFIVAQIDGGDIGNPGKLGNAIRNTEGGAIGNFYGKRFAGFTREGKWLFYKADGSVGTTDEMVDEDKAVIGNGMPNYYASLTNTFRYKNFDLTVFFRGKFDFDILNTVDMFYGSKELLPNNVLTSAFGKYSHINDAAQYSDYYLEKGDFVKLDNLTLGYNFDLPKDGDFKRLRLYASARNVATITGYSDGNRDPEVQDTGLNPGLDDRDFYPRTTTLSIGLNVNF